MQEPDLVPTERGLSVAGIELDYDGCGSCARWLRGERLRWQYSFDTGTSQATITGCKTPEGIYLCSIGGMGGEAVEVVIRPAPTLVHALEWCSHHRRWPPPNILAAPLDTAPLDARMWASRRR